MESIKAGDIKKLYLRATRYSLDSFFEGVETIEFCRCEDCGLQHFFPMTPGSQEFYESMQNFEWYYFDDKPEFNVAAQYINDGADVLEIGAGKGAFAKKMSFARYTGLEFSRNAIEVAQRNGIRLLAQSIEDYSKGHREEHDVVCNFQVLEHVGDVRGFLGSSIACLKPGGMMIISVPSADSFGRYAKNFWTDMPPHHLTRWTDRALTSIAELYGLELVAIQHEAVQEAHKSFYAATIFSNAFDSVLGKSRSQVDFSFSSRVIEKMSSILGRFFSRGLVDEVLLPRGISVVAVYRKPVKE